MYYVITTYKYYHITYIPHAQAVLRARAKRAVVDLKKNQYFVVGLGVKEALFDFLWFDRLLFLVPDCRHKVGSRRYITSHTRKVKGFVLLHFKMSNFTVK